MSATPNRPNPRRSDRAARSGVRAAALRRLVLACLAGAALTTSASAAEVSQEQRGTAERVAQAGVPLSALAEGAPERHAVKPGDTLWALSALFLKSPWRWPELWGMNLQDIRNPHLIWPGQILVLVREGDRATLQLASRAATPAAAAPPPQVEPEPDVTKWSPRVRSESTDGGTAAVIPAAAVAPFLEQTAIFAVGELDGAPSVLGGTGGRSLLAAGELAYVRGVVPDARRVNLYRTPRALIDPQSGELLGYEARLVGAAEFVSPAESLLETDSRRTVQVPAAYRIQSARFEVLPGDLLAAVSATRAESSAFMPRAPARAVQGQVVAVQLDALSAGQHQVVTLNRGSRDGIERGHVLTVWKAGSAVGGPAAPSAGSNMRGPDEPSGHLMVVSISERVSQALVMQVRDPVRRGDRFGSP